LRSVQLIYWYAVPLPEKALIAQIRQMARSDKAVSARARPDRQKQVDKAWPELAGGSVRPTPAALIAGIGDDCAVLRLLPEQDSLVTTDFSLEGIHFRRDWHPAESVGHRCLARGLSDIAAMGGNPVAAFLSLALPPDLPQTWVGGFLRGLIGLAEKHGVSLAGGDTAESPDGVLADIIVVGTVAKGTAVMRSGARPGDRIFVSGELGGSAAAVQQMQARSQPGKSKKKLNPGFYPRHFYPEPRLALGRLLRQKGLASAMIDTSDGLSTDLAHICEASGQGAELDDALIPRARVGRPVREVDLDLALHGGEDYELLFTVPPGKRIPAQVGQVAVTQIGMITRSRGILARDAKGIAHPLHPRGWEYFKPWR
jgi:thiamine-monophosphate kinase